MKKREKINLKIKKKPRREISQEEKKEEIKIEQPPQETSNFRKLALEEIVPTLDQKEPANLERGIRRIRVAEEEKPEEKTTVYDLDKAIKGGDYHNTESYSMNNGGDYDSIQKAGTRTPTMQDSFNQDQNTNPFQGTNQARSYETEGEKKLKENRKRGFW